MPLNMCHLSAETVACEPCISLSIVCRAEPVHDMETGAPCALPQARNRLISWQRCLASDLVYTGVHVAIRWVLTELSCIRALLETKVGFRSFEPSVTAA